MQIPAARHHPSITWEPQKVIWDGAELKAIFTPSFAESALSEAVRQELFPGIERPTERSLGFEPTAVVLPGKPADYFPNLPHQ
jgi:hypothetical protein